MPPESTDWALVSSTVARDVVYHRNLELGRRLEARLLAFARRRDRAWLHTRLSDDDGQVVADVYTVKQVDDGDEPGASRP